MSYQIHYPGLRRYKGRGVGNARLPILTGLCFLLFLLLVRYQWPEGMSRIRSALDRFASGLMMGESVMATLTDFLSRILV